MASRPRIRRFKGPYYLFAGYPYKGWTELAELLARITPGALTKSYGASGGSEAIDIALQAAMVRPKRRTLSPAEHRLVRQPEEVPKPPSALPEPPVLVRE
jgi:hypothetical protein